MFPVSFLRRGHVISISKGYYHWLTKYNIFVSFQNVFFLPASGTLCLIKLLGVPDRSQATSAGHAFLDASLESLLYTSAPYIPISYTSISIINLGFLHSLLIHIQFLHTCSSPKLTLRISSISSTTTTNMSDHTLVSHNHDAMSNDSSEKPRSINDGS